nr:MAG TPA: hypothetical protein [Caudoviricetes sp.]
MNELTTDELLEVTVRLEHIARDYMADAKKWADDVELAAYLIERAKEYLGIANKLNRSLGLDEFELN